MNDIPEKAKPTIFYTTNSDSTRSSSTDKNRRGGHSRSDKPANYKTRNDKNRDGKVRDDRARDNDSRNRQQGRDKQDAWKAKRPAALAPDTNDRIETFKPNRAKPSRTYQDERSATSKEYRDSDKSRTRDRNTDHAENYQDSPWQKSSKVKPTNESASYDANRQRKEETLVYSENSCKSVFKHRPEAIIKAFITQEVAPQFKQMIEWLVSQRLGYDVVDAEQITKMTETPHHGGICLIVKKRESVSVISYLTQHQENKKDYVLAIDDVTNPHNLGGLARTAAFYGISGLMLRQTALLESGAAMRVAEGGSESLTPIKTDDFVASLDQFKQKGYQIVVLLPCQVASAQASELHNVKLASKTVFVIFQRINPKLIDCADDVVYLKGTDNMAALNISVATGILLSKIAHN